MVTLALAGCTSHSSVSADAGGGPKTKEVQLLSLASWLGQLDPYEEPLADGGTTSYGGLSALSSYFQAERMANPNTLVVGAGNAFGASPPLSGQFEDVPAVKGFELLGVAADSLSDHNFDNGLPSLQTLVTTASYPFVSSNLQAVGTVVSAKVQVPYVLLPIDGVTIGVIGLTDPNAINITVPGGFTGLTIDPPIAASIVAARAARAAGAQAVVALSDYQTTGVGFAGVHTGPLMDFAQAISGVDVVLGVNTNGPGVVQSGSALVVEHDWRGKTYGRTHLRFAADTGAFTGATAEVVPALTDAVPPDPAAEALLAGYRAQLAQAFDARAGQVNAVYPYDGTVETTETAVGDLVADAFLARYAPQGAQIAVTNGGSIRDGLPSAYLPADKTLRRPPSGYAAGPPYDAVVGDAYAIYPFEDLCVLRPVTGAVLWQMLEQSVFSAPAASNGFLQVAGFQFTYSLSAGAGARVQSVQLLDGTTIPRASTTVFQLVDNDYIDRGGDSYGMLVQAAPAPGRDPTADVLVDYLRSAGPFPGTVAGRITQAP